jgi:hypothetical protein
LSLLNEHVVGFAEICGQHEALQRDLRASNFRLLVELKNSQEGEEYAYSKLKQLREPLRNSSKVVSNSAKQRSGISKGVQACVDPDQVKVDKADVTKFKDKNSLLTDSNIILSQQVSTLQKQLTDSSTELDLLRKQQSRHKEALAKLQNDNNLLQLTCASTETKELHQNKEVVVLEGKLQACMEEVASLEALLAAEKIKSERNRDAAATVWTLSVFFLSYTLAV